MMILERIPRFRKLIGKGSMLSYYSRFRKNVADDLQRRGYTLQKLAVMSPDDERPIIEEYVRSLVPGTQVAFLVFKYLTIGLETGSVERTNGILTRLRRHKLGNIDAENIQRYMLIAHYAKYDKIGRHIARKLAIIFITDNWPHIVDTICRSNVTKERCDIDEEHRYTSRRLYKFTSKSQLPRTVRNLQSVGLGGRHTTYDNLGGRIIHLGPDRASELFSAIRSRLPNIHFGFPEELKKFSERRELLYGSSLLQCMTLSGLRHTTTAGVLYNRVKAVISPLIHSICHYVKRGNTLHSMYEWISYRLAKLH